MKKLLTVAALLVVTYASQAQGSVSFSNRNTSAGVDAPVFDVNGTTKLEGAAFLAGLYEGNNLVGAAVPFRTGAGAGYWAGSERAVSVAPGSPVTLTVKAWEASGGATYAAALGKVKTGSSAEFTVTTGGAGNPPSLPANLVGLKSFNLQAVPEPTTLALGALGAAALLFRRRK